MPVHLAIISDAVFGSAPDPGIGLDHGLDVGPHYFGIFLGEVGAYDDAMPGRSVGLHAVEYLAGETAERKKLGERHEVGMTVDLLLLEVGRADLGTLADKLEIVGRPFAVLHGL